VEFFSGSVSGLTSPEPDLGSTTSRTKATRDRHKLNSGPVVASPKSSSASPPRPSAARPRVPTTLILPHDAPDWFRQGLKMMQSQDFGPSWKSLVVAWFKYEEKHAFDTKGPRLDLKHRPEVIKRWIQFARKNINPNSREMANFEVDFWRWWNYLQPSWRDVDSKSTPRVVEGTWDVIDKHGVNGLYSVIGALHLWRSHGDEGSLALWTCAVEDVCWVLSTLLESA